MRSFKSSSEVLSATSGLGLAGTSRRGGAGGIGGCWSPGPWRMKPPGPIERYCRSDGGRCGVRTGRAGPGWAGAAGVGRGRVRARRGLGGRAAGAASGLFGFLLLARLDRRGALLEPETVRLADHRVAADSAQFVGDLAGGGAIVPHLLQALDALFGPRHILICSKLARPFPSR